MVGADAGRRRDQGIDRRFPEVVLAEGDYRVIARNEGRSFQHDFNVVAGVDREISVVAQ